MNMQNNNNKHLRDSIRKIEETFIIERYNEYVILISRTDNNKQIRVWLEGNNIDKKVKHGWTKANITYSGSGEYPTLRFPGRSETCKIHVLKIILFKREELMELLETGEKIDIHHVDYNKYNYDINNLQPMKYSMHLEKHNKHKIKE